jgi:hypothetical protein
MRAMRWMVLVWLACVFGCGDDETGTGEGSPAPCGPVSCTGTEYCCDAACGLCVPEGVACTDTCAP